MATERWFILPNGHPLFGTWKPSKQTPDYALGDSLPNTFLFSYGQIQSWHQRTQDGGSRMGEHQGVSVSTGGLPFNKGKPQLRDEEDSLPRDAEHQQAPKEPRWHMCPHWEHHPHLHNSMGLVITETMAVVVHTWPKSSRFLPPWVLTSSPWHKGIWANPSWFGSRAEEGLNLTSVVSQGQLGEDGNT